MADEAGIPLASAMERALGAVEEAVKFRRGLVATRPDEVMQASALADLAAALNNQSAMLSGVGRGEAALAAVEEAVEIRRGLAAKRADAFEPDLASSLNNQSLMLSGLGRHEEAVAASEEAVAVYRRLAADRADKFLPDLATALSNQSLRLGELERHEEALSAVVQAVEIRRGLAETRPDAFLPNLAMSLSNQSGCLAGLGRDEDALRAIGEAVEIYRELVDTRAEGFLPRLATALTTQSLILARLARPEDALAAMTEAIELYRGPDTARPEAARADLATALNSQSLMLSGLERRDDALAAIEEAVEIYRELAKTRAATFLPKLALSLSNQSNRLSELARREDALAATEEAVEIWRGLATARPDGFRQARAGAELATALSNQSGSLSLLGRREDALKTIEEAVAIRRELATAHPDATLRARARADLATALNNQAGWLSDLSRRGEALTAIEEAVAIRRELATAHPDAFPQGSALADLATAVNNQALMLGGAGRRDEALAASEEAVGIYRELAAQRADALLDASALADLATALTNASVRLGDAGRREDALAASEESVEILRQLEDARPDAFLPDLTTALTNQADRLSELGRRQEALRTIEEALSLMLPTFESAEGGLSSAGLKLVQAYLKRAEGAESDADPDMLQRIQALLVSAGLIGEE
jgi:tetratricopeptide (TPR) repeat protein